MLHRSAAPFLLLRRRSFSSSVAGTDNIIASVLFERLPVIVPKIHPVVYAFQEFSFQWRNLHSRKYPDEFLDMGEGRGKGDRQTDFVPAPRITEADKNNDKRSLQRALDRRLYLLIYGSTYGDSGKKPVWHFPEKMYENEETMRMCAESALKSVIGELDHTYFVGNAPMGHITCGPSKDSPDTPSLKRFFFKSQVLAGNKLNIGKCEDHVWVSKDELLNYFPEHAAYLNHMIIN